MKGSAHISNQGYFPYTTGSNYLQSEIWKIFQLKNWDKLTFGELKLIAQAISKTCDIPLSRESKRSIAFLIKWYELNWGQLSNAVNGTQLTFDYKN